MDPIGQELLESVKKVARSETMRHASALYELGSASYSNGMMAQAIAQFDATVETGDPYYSVTALYGLAVIYKHLKDSARELLTFRTIVNLPPEARRFSDPENLGMAYLRLGDIKSAIEQYFRAIQFNGMAPSRAANLAEALIVDGQYQEARRFATYLLPIAESKYWILGRVFMGAALWLAGEPEKGLAQFRFVGDHLVSAGSMPAFAWDFRDSIATFDRVDSTVAQAVFGLLEKKIDFATFRQTWSAEVPAQ